MASTNPLPATDSANELRPILGDDATATFETDANFIDSNPGENGSSENLPEQRSAASSESISARKKALDEEDDEDEDDEDLDDEDDDDEELDDDDDDEEYEDDEDLDDEDEDDDEDLDDDDEDDEEEDDEDEVKASSVLRADGLLGYEDEAEDVNKGINREQGDAERAEAEEDLKDGEQSYGPHSHEDGKWEPVERDDTPEAEGALIGDRAANPDFVPPYRAFAPTAPSHVSA